MLNYRLKQSCCTVLGNCVLTCLEGDTALNCSRVMPCPSVRVIRTCSAPARYIRQFVFHCVGRLVLCFVHSVAESFRLEGTPYSNRGSLGQVVQDSVQLGFEYLHRQKLRKLSGQLVSVLDCCQSKKLFSCVWIEFHGFNFFVCSCFVIFTYCLLPLSVGATEKSLSPSSSFPCIGYYTH